VPFRVFLPARTPEFPVMQFRFRHLVHATIAGVIQLALFRAELAAVQGLEVDELFQVELEAIEALELLSEEEQASAEIHASTGTDSVTGLDNL
jgi:hypothetical protein